MPTLLQTAYERVPPEDPSIWHKWNMLLWPVRTIDKKWTMGNVWRRRHNGRWEYRERPETLEEQLDRLSW